MKKMKIISKVFFVALATLALSCSDDENGGGGGGTPSGTYVKAKVDGTTYETYKIQGVSAANAISTGSGDGRLIMIGGPIDVSATKAWSVNLMGINSTGEYAIGPDSNSTVAYVDTANNVSYDNSDCDGATGTIKITKINDQEVEGTFSLTAKNDEDCSMSKQITNGSFRGVFSN